MGKRKPLPPVTDEELNTSEISEAYEAVISLGDVATTLKHQIDQGSLETRQETIKLYHRARRQWIAAVGLCDALRRRYLAHKERMVA